MSGVATDAPPVATPLKREPVEVWTFVSPHGVTVSYEIRPEFGEKGQLLYNAIDHSPVSVELSFKRCDELNEPLGILSFPVVNSFSYGMMRSERLIYAPGGSPAELELRAREQRREQSLLSRQRRIQSIMGDEPNDPATTP